MKNEIRISRLMDAYTDNEFFIQGESEVNIEMVKKNVVKQAEKKRIKPVSIVLIGAAAAAVLAGGVTATIAMKGEYTTPMGISVSYEIGENYSSWSMHFDEDRVVPIKVEEGNRLMFVGNGQNIDITDLVDGNTPYIYSYKNSDGDTCYTVAGGAAGDYGYIDLIPTPMDEDLVRWSEIGYNTHVPEEQWIEHPEDITVYDDDEMKEEKWEAFRKANDEAYRSMFKSWCLAAFDELGIWGEISTYGENVAPKYIAEFNESIGYVYPSE